MPDLWCPSLYRNILCPLDQSPSTEYNPPALKERLIITIDGPAGSGKSTVAAALARTLGITYLDTGAMYRAVTLCALQQDIDLDDPLALEDLTRNCPIQLTPLPQGTGVSFNGRDITAAIRANEVTAASHKIAAVPALRELLVTQQRQIATEAGALVTEGRDQGTIVFPDTPFKFYLDASPACRAQRRCEQLDRQGQPADYEEILAAQEQRDQRDSSRQTGPLKIPDDAIVIDTTGMSIEAVVAALSQHIDQLREKDK